MARILLIDDDPDILVMGKKILASQDHDVFTSKDAIEAMDKLNDKQFDLVLSDANMPHYSGFDLIKTIRADKRHENVIVAFLTARKSKDDIEKAMKLGASDYIIKPIDPTLLIQKVDTLLRKSNNSFLQYKFSYQENAELLYPVQVLSLSEIGMVFQSTQPFLEGHRIKINAPVFNKIGIEPPVTKVISTNIVPGKQLWQVRVSFWGTSDTTLQKIRAWLYANISKDKKHAA